MAKPIDLTVIFDAPLDRVWAELSDLASHPEWMSDAGYVEFLSDSRQGVGTLMRAATEVGPIRLADTMRVTEWVELERITVDHVGAVTGSGSFAIRPTGDGTELRWVELLNFPWWLGGRIGAAVARPILSRIWRGSLEKLRARVELSGP
jgi:uncharacterized protein YndB with AHSA1/START domain